MQNNKALWWGIAIIILLGILFYIPRIGKKTIETDVPCLVANVPLKQHIHPILKITVDGVAEAIQANIGLGACERALHTHDTTGTLHVEAQDDRKYTLKDFIGVWGKEIERKGYTLVMKVNGKETPASNVLEFKDKQEILLEYTKK